MNKLKIFIIISIVLAASWSLPNISQADFVGSIAVTSPNGGETLTVGQTYRITWNSNGIDTVTLYAADSNGTLTVLASTIPNNGYYDWSVNVGNTTQTQFKIQVTGYKTGVGSTTDTSDGFFTIPSSFVTPTPTSSAPVPTISNISPATAHIGDLITLTGTNFPSRTFITFTNSSTGNKFSDGVGSLDGKQIFYPVSGSLGAGNYSVTVSNIDNFNSNPFAFSLLPAWPRIQVLSPVGGQTYKYGDPITIQWSDPNSSIHTYNLDLQSSCTQGGQIAHAVSGTQYAWNAGQFINQPASTGSYHCDFFVNISTVQDSAFGSSSLFTIDRTVSSLPANTGAPTIDSFIANSSTIVAGQSTTLSWSISNATIAYLSVDGKVIASTGSQVVSPRQTTTYTITANNNYGTSTKSVTIVVQYLNSTPIPTLTGLNPTSGPVGTTVTATGTGFLGTNTVNFNNGITVNTTSNNNSSLQFQIPSSLAPGQYTVYISNNNQPSATQPFIVTAPQSLPINNPAPAPLTAPTAPSTSPSIKPGESYPVGTLIKDGQTIYVVTEPKVSVAFTSWSAFTGLGYQLKNVINGSITGYRVSTSYYLSSPAQVHPWGAWVNNKGTIYYLHPSGPIGVPSWQTFLSNGGQTRYILPISKSDLDILNSNPNLAVMTENDLRMSWNMAH